MPAALAGTMPTQGSNPGVPPAKLPLITVDIRDLTYFSALFDAGSYARAAKVLHIDTSTLSRRISGLEDELGVLLFERTRAGVRLTPTGQDLLRIARRALGDLDQIRENAAQAGMAQLGRLKLATQISTLGPNVRRALQGFRATHPKVGIQLTEGSDQDIVVGLSERRHDVALLFTPALPPDLAALELWTEKLVLAVPRRHRLATADAVRWADVQSEAMLVRGWSGSHAFREFEAGLIGPSVRFRTHQAGCVDLLNLVAIDEGVMISLESHREITIPEVKFIDIDEPDALVGIALAWSPDLEDPVAGSFLAYMRDHHRGDQQLSTNAVEA